MAAPKKKTGKALVVWEKQFADLAKEDTQGIKAMEGKFLSFRGGKMSYAGADIPDDEIRCIIVGWTHHNTYYDPSVPYDPDAPENPVCFAFGQDEEEMAPDDASTDKQADACTGCPMNEFGSARKGKKAGKGKACKNGIRLALVAEDQLDLKDITKAEVIYAQIPPTSRKNWLVYLTKSLRDGVKRPHWAVITKLARIPDDKSQFRITFDLGDLIEDTDLFAPLQELANKTRGVIAFPPVVREDAAPVKTKKPAKSQKFAGRR